MSKHSPHSHRTSFFKAKGRALGPKGKNISTLPWIFPGINFPTLMGSDTLGGWFFVPDVTRGSEEKFIRGKREGGRGKHIHPTI